MTELSVVNPRTSPVYVLVAEQMSTASLSRFATTQTASTQPTFFHDCSAGSEPSSEILAKPGVHYIYKPNLSSEQILAESQVRSYTGIMVRPKTVLPETNVAMAVRIGTGTDNLTAWGAVAGKNRIVMNTPGQNSSATAEYAIKALFQLLAPTEFRQANNETRANQLTSADLNRYFSTEIRGKTIAIIGMGDIGTEVARILKALRAGVVGYSPHFTDEEAASLGIKRAATIEAAMKDADAVTFHMPGGKETDNIIGANALVGLKKGAVLVNAARASIIDMAALDAALASGQVSGFIIDADRFLMPDGKPDTKRDKLQSYLDLISKYEGKEGYRFFVTPHFGGDVTRETNDNATWQGLVQMNAALYDHLVYNARTPVPAGYTNGGVVKPEGIGRPIIGKATAQLVAQQSQSMVVAGITL